MSFNKLWSGGYTSTLTVPATPNGVLAEKVRDHTRLRQHLAAYKTASAAQLPAQPQHVDPLSRPRAAKSWMWEHTRDKHQGIVGPNEGRDDYKVKVEGRFLKCLYQQVDEDVRMQLFEASGGELLN